VSRTGARGVCYLIHFSRRLKHAAHYLGWTEDLPERLRRHRAGDGARLLQVIQQAGISWTLVRLWRDVDRQFERRLKRRGGRSRLCPICLARRRGLKP
jgi:predicted GIY-YIG superfamily endonuclease